MGREGWKPVVVVDGFRRGLGVVTWMLGVKCDVKINQSKKGWCKR